jgi:hypothetical protein
MGCVAATICVAGPVAALSSRDAALVPRKTVEIRQAGRTIVIKDGTMEVRGEVVDTSNIPAPNLAPLSPTPRGGSPVLEQALINAVSAGDMNAVSQLIAQGVSVNASLDGEGSPLIVAARAGSRDMVDLLLAKGANIDMGVEGDGNPLIAAAAAGHADLVRHLLNRGANIEAVVLTDENALMQASYHGHGTVVRLLIERGANVNSRVGSRTPLKMGQLGGHASIVTLLEDAGATV